MKRGLFLFFVFCAISNAYAQMDCESIPSCAEMGYTQESCSGGKGVRCPFDESKFYCAGAKQLPDAPEPVVTPEDWTAGCADKIAYCTAYNNDCQCTACESGYLLSEGDCVPACDKSVDICAAESKTFNSANCTCEACPTNYLLVDGVCKKMCTVVENCKTYDSEYDPCNCTACEDGYELSNGACVPAGCDKSVDICAARIKIFNSVNCTCEACPMGSYLTTGYNNDHIACYRQADYHCKVDYCVACDLTNSVCVACGYNRILKDNKCVLRENKCSHGTIIYDDFQCYKEDQVPSGRVPIGIVINSTNGHKKPGKLKILSLDSVDLPWSENLSTTKTGCDSRSDGKANTDCIIAAGAEEDSAAVYCNNYGVMDDDKGKWFLPSIQEVLILGDPFFVDEFEDDNRFLDTALNTALNSLGNSTESHIGDKDGLLSSTEYSGTQAIYSSEYSSVDLSMDYASRHYKASKTKKMRVRCVREFEDAPTIEHCYDYTRYGCRYCDNRYMVSEDRASCIQASCSEIEYCEKYDPTTCRCVLCSPRRGRYPSSDGFTCVRPILHCEDQKDNVCEACQIGYVLSYDKLRCIAQ